MRFLADTNWLVAAYFADQDVHRTEIVTRFTARWDLPWLVSPVVLLESRNVFASLSARQNPPEWRRLQDVIGTRLIVPEMTWEAIEAKAQEFFQRFSHKARIGTLDAMLIGAGVIARATHFLSFDKNSNARAMAAVLKLKVFPELTAEDRRRMALFR